MIFWRTPEQLFSGQAFSFFITIYWQAIGRQRPHPALRATFPRPGKGFRCVIASKKVYPTAYKRRKERKYPTMTVFFSQLINGLSLGSIYALIALGYSMCTALSCC